MYLPVRSLKTPEDFQFPFKPYEIQQDLMKKLYEVIENKEIGIFESPTGTGKSLTLTCGAIKWLEDHETLIKTEINEKLSEIIQEIDELENVGNTSEDWITIKSAAIVKKNELLTIQKLKLLIEEYEKKLKDLKENKLLQEKKKGFLKVRQKIEDLNVSEAEDNDVLEDCEDNQMIEEDVESNGYKSVKIYFCSRTHSQLSQVVREIKRTCYGTRIRCVTLASRQNLCINPLVKNLSSASLINERCLDLQKSQSKSTSTDVDGKIQKKSKARNTKCCSFKKHDLIEEFRDNSLVEILDIEDLIKMGTSLTTCPYYSTRIAQKDAQIIMLPYQILLHHRTRQQSGIELKNNIIIIDEAHNLLDTISNIYTNELNLQQLQLVNAQIMNYKKKYFNYFNSMNLLKINQLIFITKQLMKLLTNKIRNDKIEYKMFTITELLTETGFFNINLYTILDFCEKTRFAQKVHSFSQRYPNEIPLDNIEAKESSTKTVLKRLEEEFQNKNKRKKKEENQTDTEKECVKEKISVTSVIRPFLEFLESLIDCPNDGRIMIKYDEDSKKTILKFLLLNPGSHFNEIIQECRSVIIAGGTMQPTTDLINQLFKTCPQRVKQYFYGHVVPSNSVLPLIIPRGPSGKRFYFNFTQRNNFEMLSELGMTLQNICNVVPAGIVCFFPSYDYLETVYKHILNNGNLKKIEYKKFIFREPRNGHSIEKILSNYATSIRDPQRQGAILFSVVGGKLSEGLNFTDDLGRCVIVVGMPYPNLFSPELKEKAKYLDEQQGHGNGNEYCDNLCMKAVNQCIGRSIRHINDYACVLLLDERYINQKVNTKLPSWILRSIRMPDTFGISQGLLAKFFKEKANILKSKD